MRKLLLNLLTVFVAILVLVGCTAEEPSNAPKENQESQAENGNSEQNNELTASITISLDQETEIIEEKDVSFEEGALLLDVLKENFEIEEKDGFVTSIEGISAKEGETKFWAFFVNGEMATVGAGEYEVKSGDSISFDFQSWE